MRIAVLAGEASGDLLGSRVLAALRARFPGLVVEGIGGPLMEAQGLRSMFPMERLSVMGLVEPLKRLPELLRIRRAVYQQFIARPPDIFLGIDAPDFNLRLERRLRERGIRTAHLVSPSVWAWRRGRIHGIGRAVDLMLCLFPFETAIYERSGIAARFVGHPLADEIPLQPDRAAARQALGLDSAARVLALLPGSRAAEVRLLAPLFLQAARGLRQSDPALVLALPAANAARCAELEQLLPDYPDLDITLVQGRAREVMAACDSALLASGTATLEAALLKRPMVVAYRTGALGWLLLRWLVKTPYAALPNILAGRALVPELLQQAATPAAMVTGLQPLLAGEPAAARQVDAFADIHRQLRQGFGDRVAEALSALAAGRGA
ncbi:MAG: lipid-A-disaccharide synthase [Halieaceae bacterium]|jgi:lipid-A-disaccharide synthase|nr:lipid-A-disaccharide synthase [Halieaceae bacterium]